MPAIEKITVFGDQSRTSIKKARRLTRWVKAEQGHFVPMDFGYDFVAKKGNKKVDIRQINKGHVGRDFTDCSAILTDDRLPWGHNTGVYWRTEEKDGTIFLRDKNHKIKRTSKKEAKALVKNYLV